MLSVFKLKNGSVAVIVAIPVSSNDVEFTNDEEVNNLEESNDKENVRIVVKRMAKRDLGGSFFCVRRRPTLAGLVETTQSRGKWKEVFQCSVGFVVIGQG